MAQREILLLWASQPQEVVELDRDASSRFGIVGGFIHACNYPALRDLLTNVELGVSSLTEQSQLVSQYGTAIAIGGTANTGTQNVTYNTGEPSGQSFTFLARVRTSASGVFGRGGTTLPLWRASGLFDMRINNTNYAAAGTWTAGEWYDITIIGSPSSCNLYVNGALVISGAACSSAAISSTMTIGEDGSGGGGGDIDVQYCLWSSLALPVSDAYDLHQTPWQLFAPQSIWIPVSAGGGSTSYTITPSGGITLAGSGLDLRTKVVAPTGGVSFAGTGNATFSSGGTEYTITPSGGVTISGTSDFIKTKVLEPSGGVVFGGTGVTVNTKVVAPTGGVIFGGTGSMESNVTPVATGSSERTKVGVGT